MSSLRNSIKKADPAPEKKEEIMLNLNLLFELATSKCDHFKTQIADNIRTAGTIENPTIPITHIIADTSEMRAYCKDDSTKIVGEATNAIKSFVTGGSENVISGVGALIGAGINMLMGSGEGVQAEHSDYFIMVDGLALVRIDVKSWIRKVTVVGITQKIESVLAFTAVKSSVDVDKISFNTFMEAYKYQLQRDAAHALNENDLMKEIKRAKEVYNLLKTDSRSFGPGNRFLFHLRLICTSSRSISDNLHSSHYPTTPDFPNTISQSFQYLLQIVAKVPSPIHFSILLNR